MKLRLFLFVVAWCSLGCHQKIVRSNQSTKEAQEMTQGKKTNSSQKFVLVASVPNNAERSVRNALKRAGIAYEADGSRATGFRVRESDTAYAKNVIKFDSELHQYKVEFVD